MRQPIIHLPVLISQQFAKAANTNLRLITNALHEICEGLHTLQHKAQFSISMDQIGELSERFVQHVGQVNRKT